MNRILVIEDEDIILKALKKLLQRNHFEVTTANTVEQAIEAQPQSFDLILADLRLPGVEGTDIIPIADPIPVVIMTSHASVRSAVSAMRYGAIDYIAKPFDHDELLLIIERSLLRNRMRAQNQSLRQDLKRLVPAENINQCKGMSELIENLSSLDNSERFIALHGESGTGKELLARAAHASSDRADAPFVVADLPSLDTTRMHATLLGGERPMPEEDFMPGGLLHSAHNGTLIIRHPGALPQNTQLALAQALDNRETNGITGIRSVNVRTIIISDVALEQQMSDGTLHADLAGLFTDNEFLVPALRNMQSDIAVLADHYLQHFCRHHHRQTLKFSDNAKAALLAYRWPGNTDELKNVVERAVLLARDHQITPNDLSLSSLSDDSSQHELSLDEYFRFFVTRHQSKLSETELASRLGISRKALWERRQKMQLQRDQSAE